VSVTGLDDVGATVGGMEVGTRVGGINVRLSDESGAIRVLLTTQLLVINRIKMAINKNKRNSKRWVAGFNGLFLGIGAILFNRKSKR